MTSYDERWSALEARWKALLAHADVDRPMMRRLKDARDAALSVLTSIELDIERDERVAAFNKRLHEECSTSWSTYYDAMPHDGRGIDSLVLNTRFTILPCKGEVWAERNGHRLTSEPLIFNTDDEIINYIKETA